jgi:hypothetical protein
MLQYYTSGKKKDRQFYPYGNNVVHGAEHQNRFNAGANGDGGVYRFGKQRAKEMDN